MALTPGTLTITFTSEYTGCHRVCYRQNSSGGYTCVDTTCTGGGASCSVAIAITVDNETCSNVSFDGYAQACCEDVSSLTGRIPFSATFVPSPACKRYLATCNSAALASVTVTNGGSGYASAPAISFTGGGGSGAAAHSTIGAGIILTSAIGAGGTYNVDGTYVGVDMVGSATGTGAKATVTIAGNTVTILTITTPGTGYRNTDVIYPTAAAVGGATVNATINITTDYQTVTSIVLDALGSGYTSVPTVVIAPGGSGAAGTAVLGYCVGFAVDSCTGTGRPVEDDMIQPGQSVDFCTAGTPPAPANYTIIQDTGNCLCNCTSTTLTATGSSGSVQFRATLCNGAVLSGTANPLGSPSSATACIVTGSLIIKNVGGAVGVITTNGAC